MNAEAPLRIKLTPARLGWHSRVVGDLMTTEPPWWRPTKRGARRAAQRYLNRSNRRDTREAQSTYEEGT